MKTLKELMDLSGRVALITGGSGYVGSTAGQSLAELGAKVAVLDIEQEKCDAVATVLSETYKVDCVGLAVDLSATDEIARVPARVKERLGRLDIIIHSAAYTANVPGWAVPFEEQSVEPWDRAMAAAPGRAGGSLRSCVAASASSGAQRQASSAEAGLVCGARRAPLPAGRD